MAGRKGAWQTISDPAQFGDLIRGLVDDSHHGNVSEAARAWGISQPTLSRLCRGSLERITKTTWFSLSANAGSSVEEMGALIVTEAAMTSYALYTTWMTAEITRITAEPPPWMPRLQLAGITVKPKRQQIRNLEARLRSEAPHVLSELNKLGLEKARARLARLRILEPFLLCGIDGWVELTADELSSSPRSSGKTFRKLVDAGWARERLLLRRQRSWQRAQRVLEESPIRRAYRLVAARRRAAERL